MLRIGVNGYGTIGKRVADAVSAQPDMRVAGVAKARPNHTADYAHRAGYDVYTAGDGGERFGEAGIEPAGDVDDLIGVSDVVVDATPAGTGAEYRPRYAARDTPAVFQGGESAGVAPVSFTARANYEAAVGEPAVRVVSCNTTGLNRLFAPLLEAYGIDQVTATLVRCRGDIGVISPDPIALPSHHGPDVQAVLPAIERIQTLGIRVPTTRHHVHSVHVRLEEAPTSADSVRDLLAAEDRIRLLDRHLGIDSTWELREYALDRGRPRMDLWENRVWSESITVEGCDLYCFQTIHRESDVVPENVDAIRAITGDADAAGSMATTNEALGIGDDWARPEPVPA